PLGAVAGMISGLAERFSRDALGASSGKYGKFTFAIFGWCPVLSRFAIYRSTPHYESSRFYLESSETLPRDTSTVVSFGSGEARLKEHIANIREHGDRFQRTGRIPKLAIEALLGQDQVGDVGGSPSIGIATKVDFRLYSHMT